jgi:hypothetical protein
MGDAISSLQLLVRFHSRLSCAGSRSELWNGKRLQVLGLFAFVVPPLSLP